MEELDGWLVGWLVGWLCVRGGDGGVGGGGRRCVVCSYAHELVPPVCEYVHGIECELGCALEPPVLEYVHGIEFELGFVLVSPVREYVHERVRTGWLT